MIEKNIGVFLCLTVYKQISRLLNNSYKYGFYKELLDVSVLLNNVPVIYLIYKMQPLSKPTCCKQTDRV